MPPPIGPPPGAIANPGCPPCCRRHAATVGVSERRCKGGGGSDTAVVGAQARGLGQRGAHLGLGPSDLGLRVCDRLVDGKYDACGLGRCGNGIDLDYCRFPNRLLKVVSNALLEHIHPEPLFPRRVLLPQLVQDVRGVKPRVVAQLPRNHLERLRKATDDELLLALDLAGVVAKLFGQLHFNGATARHNSIVLDGPPHNHDGVVKRPLRFLDELLGPPAEDQRACLGLRAPLEEVVPLATDLPLLKECTLAQHI
mmetsp:Transcript_20838/g.54147  ORF Transcript_20838/g.54147 Transcript_20838/m.54147 type:complete len:254 (+) Transcript_20838:861-1622(+)